MTFGKVCTLFFLSVYTAYIGTLLVLDVKPVKFFWGFSTIAIPAIEVAFFAGLTIALWQLRTTRLRFLMLLLLPVPLAVLSSVYAVQLGSMVIASDYITPLAMDNMTEKQYIMRVEVAAAIAFLALFWGSLFLFAWKDLPRSDQPRLSGKAWACTGLVTVLYLGSFDASSKNSEYPDLLRPDLAPFTGLVHTADIFFNGHEPSLEMVRLARRVGRGEVTPPFEFDPKAEYPFARDSLGAGPLPFAKVENGAAPLNVVVIFAEGFSARLMNTYGGKYADLTPNLNSFAETAMVVDGYYNHTAATFRGLQGQLTSGYPLAGGASKWEDWDGAEGNPEDARSSLRDRSLARILNQRGYKSVFLSPHTDKNPLNTMLRALDFDKVYSLESLPELLGGPVPEHPEIPLGAVTDETVFQGLRSLLEAHEQSGTDQPLFAATYNIGTHAFIDAAPDGLHFHDGDNSALNRFHEFDRAVGSFLEYFVNSPSADNTILIFTADHASYPEPPVVRALQEPSYRQYFVDRIPLIIHAPHVALPRTLQANNRTSLALAPSILHLLEIDDVPNAFLGRSLFDGSENKAGGMAAFGAEFYRIDTDGVDLLHGPQDDAKTNEFIYSIKYFYDLGRQNKLFRQEQLLN
ncbi:MAG: LTA synthase family protein [Rhodobacteraceae bacterium]|nr:LTA synthase family protein [Paracoccaceae bacterium]